MKKTVVALLIVVAVLVTAFYGVGKIVNTGGIRGGDVFQNTPLDAVQFNHGGDLNMEALSDIVDCNENICIQVFSDKITEEIKLISFEKKNDKYAYIYEMDFSTDEINDKSGLEAYDIYRKSEVVYGIMPVNQKGIVLNKNITATTVPFSVGDTEYKLWYAIVDGGSDAVTSVEYK